MSLFPHVGDAVPRRRRSTAIVLAVMATLTLLAAVHLVSSPHSLPGLPLVAALAAATCGMAWLLAGRDAARDRAGKQALEGADARLAGLLDSAMDAIITVDSQQNVILYNKAAEKKSSAGPRARCWASRSRA